MTKAKEWLAFHANESRRRPVNEADIKQIQFDAYKAGMESAIRIIDRPLYMSGVAQDVINKLSSLSISNFDADEKEGK